MPAVAVIYRLSIQRRPVRLSNECAFLALRRGVGEGLGCINDAASSIANVSAFFPLRRGVIWSGVFAGIGDKKDVEAGPGVGNIREL